MRKTKIICTLGPATDRDGILEQCIESGMNVARLNFSHGSHEEQQKRIDKLYELRKKYQKPIAALLDTKGPEIRLGDFKDGKVNLKQGQKFSLVTNEAAIKSTWLLIPKIISLLSFSLMYGIFK